MSRRKDKTIKIIAPTGDGRMMAEITESNGDVSLKTVTKVARGDQIQPGETLMLTAPIDGEPSVRRIVSEFTREGPPRVSNRNYRKGYDAISWGKPPPEDLPN